MALERHRFYSASTSRFCEWLYSDEAAGRRKAAAWQAEHEALRRRYRRLPDEPPFRVSTPLEDPAMPQPTNLRQWPKLFVQAKHDEAHIGELEGVTPRVYIVSIKTNGRWRVIGQGSSEDEAWEAAAKAIEHESIAR